MKADPCDAVHHLADLDNWRADGPSLAVVGKPIKHSLSPLMHHAALAQMARLHPELGAWRYHRFELAPEELRDALPKFHRAGFVGLNFTVPHKEIVLGIANEVSPFARAAGAANTLHRTTQGWHAHNTDGYGLAAALHAEFGTSLAQRHVILLGAGGAARAAALQCIEDGAADLWIGNRSRERLNALLTHLAPRSKTTRVHGFDLAQPPSEIPAQAALINATSVGLGANDPAPIDLTRVALPACVYDMIYNPPETALLRDARRLGVPCANGLTMLVHQGARALSIWTGFNAPADVMFDALKPTNRV